jgi:Sec-independent protein translocase protein (TatC)
MAMAIPIGVRDFRGRRRAGEGGWRRYVLEWAAVLAVASQEMSFLEHLDELRRRLIWSLASVAVAFGVCWVFSAELYEIASAPIRATGAATLSVTHVQDIIGLYIKVTLVAAISGSTVSASSSHGFLEGAGSLSTADC